jgi:putative spermidine/putrescine transport system ATP-binding protein
VVPQGGPVEVGAEHAAGNLTEVVYAGPVTRYVVDLDAGPRLIALQQNGSGAATLNRGARVDLVWDAHHVIAVPDLASGRSVDRDADRSPEPLFTPHQP